jgi:hypothetical protein
MKAAKLSPKRSVWLVAAALSVVPLAHGGIATANPTKANTTVKTSEPTKEPVKDQKALDLLKQSADKIKSLGNFAIHADATRDRVVRDGFKLQRTLTEDVLVQRNPDRMRLELTRDDAHRVFIYNGKAVTLFATPENYYAIIPAAGSLAETFKDVTSSYDVELPLSDMLYVALGGDLGVDIKEAGYIGVARVAGVDCDHVAFRSSDVDWQVWIERGAQLPRKIVVTTRDEPTDPQYMAVLAWNLTPKPKEADFAFTPPESARPIRVQTLKGTKP